ncbi:hypothetical protein NXS08_04185 [Gleimia sp. 6138-11-ORH1]|uniref:hypothetical protein n=1 Tax=Gleimia sp. 6138-11-ORH1 TaxID=2973937 RepID=UPI002167C0C8|nr:hypothetical protein [Gleimia sp. 6138-11-ORH1]MCS4484685.1 hypothetical protein [Gleimia sp. 6138-11-ORH1]
MKESKFSASTGKHSATKKRFFLDILNENEQFGRVIKLPLRYLSATTVVLLLLFMAIFFGLTGQRDIITFTVAVAVVVLAYGWHDLVDAPTRNSSLITILLVGIINIIVIRLTGDLAWAGISAGLSILIAAVAETLRSAPRLNLLESLSSSVFGALVAIIGSGWVALETSQLWSTILLACTIMVAAAVVGNQVGSTLRTNAIGALVAGSISGLLLGLLATQLSNFQRIAHLALESLSSKIDPLLGMLFLTTSLGFALGGVITTVDALFGEHKRRRSEKAAFARGAMKFLLVVMPIYVLIRTGAF